MSNAPLQRGLGAYLGLAVGDALGATVEFMTPREIQAVHGVHRRIIGGGWLNLKAGTVTDDTTMSLALGRAILASGDLDGVAMAEAFSQWMRDRPVDIGHTVRRGIIRYRRTGEIETPLNDNDAGNGACMRVLPVVLATLNQPLETLHAACHLQGRITHHHPLSDAGTVCVATMVRMAIEGHGCGDLLQGPVQTLVTAHPEFRFRGKREENPSGFIVHTLRAVFQALFDTDNLEDCLVDVVNRGGDADTTGAIAGMIAGALYGEASMPQPWRNALDDRVADAVTTQAQALMAGTFFPA